ncbi:auxin-responsive protein IAA11-like [Hibiscus syriacus]|uniref:auxin-responsive protein IAA11-like n=1 Tax=Hibiscus syriacus TaxID=106335 RepID=UPI001922793F|nr:auxin-responsive protein IAA11-like [Hibiscus syriacus]
MQGGVVNVGDGGSESGSISTVSREENMVLSSEDSSCTDQSELELGLGLSVGGGAGFKMHHASKDAQFARILIPKDFPSLVTSAASSQLRPRIPLILCQVVGWPPIGAHRMNSMVNQAKAPAVVGFNSTTENCKNETSMVEKSNVGSSGKARLRQSLFVKVNMDGIPIGRKVDLNAHESYEKLAKTLEDMFLESTPSVSQVGKDELTSKCLFKYGRRDVVSCMTTMSQLIYGTLIKLIMDS